MVKDVRDGMTYQRECLGNIGWKIFVECQGHAAANCDSNSTAAIAADLSTRNASAATETSTTPASPATTSVRVAVPAITGAPNATVGSSTIGVCRPSGHQRFASDDWVSKSSSVR